MERIEILYDHYKESCELAKKNEVYALFENDLPDQYNEK